MANQTKADLLAKISELEKQIDQWESECKCCENIIDRIPIGLYRSTPDGKILVANAALISLLGYPDQESILSKNAVELYADPEDRPKWQQELTDSGAVKDFEVQWRRFDGQTIWVKESTNLIRDTDGNFLYFEGLAEDISEKKQATRNTILCSNN